jgi:hypothetical protein
MNDGNIDYSAFSRRELREALAAINREKFPRNYENLRKALETATDDPPGEARTDPPAAPPRSYAFAPRLSDRVAIYLFVGLTGIFVTAVDPWSWHDDLLSFLLIVPTGVVPIALVAWTLYQFIARRAYATAFAGLLIGGCLSCYAFLMFFANVYCEDCAGRPPTPGQNEAALWYVIFGVVMLVAMRWSVRLPKTKPAERHDDHEGQA